MNETNKSAETPSTLQERLEKIRAEHAIERGNRLKEERRRLGYSVIDFADMLEIHRNTQGNYEAGREPPTGYLAAAKEAGVDIAYVMDGERLSGVASHCANTVHKIFSQARSRRLCEVCPDMLQSLVYLVAKNDEWCSSGFDDGMDGAQIASLLDVAFRTPDEFFEAATAISKYGRRATGGEPTPKEAAEMILETLSAYVEHRSKLSLGLRDNIRIVAEDVVSLRSRSST